MSQKRQGGGGVEEDICLGLFNISFLSGRRPRIDEEKARNRCREGQERGEEGQVNMWRRPGKDEEKAQV
jgi:hypothetical protein